MGDRPWLIQVPAVTDAAPAPAAPVAAAAPVVHEAPPADNRPLAVSGSIDTASQPARPAAAAGTPPPVRKVVVVKPPDLKRPPVVVTSSAEGVVVKRNVVINVGGGTGRCRGRSARHGRAAAVGALRRARGPPMPTVGRGSGSHPVQPPADAAPVPPSTRDIRMPWDGPSPTGTAPPPVRRPAGAPSDHRPRAAP